MYAKRGSTIIKKWLDELDIAYKVGQKNYIYEVYREGVNIPRITFTSYPLINPYMVSFVAFEKVVFRYAQRNASIIIKPSDDVLYTMHRYVRKNKVKFKDAYFNLELRKQFPIFKLGGWIRVKLFKEKRISGFESYEVFPLKEGSEGVSPSSPHQSSVDINNYQRTWEDELENYTFNKCLTEKIPKVSGQLETAQYLRYTNSSLIRFGDGEIKLILGKRNYGKEEPNEELGERLKELFKLDDERIAIGIPNIFTYCPYYKKRSYHSWYIRFANLVKWMKKNINYKKQYFDLYITSPYITTYRTHCELVDKVYENMRAIWEDKDIIWLRGNNGEVYDYDVFDNARSKKVYYGLANYSWPKYEEYRELLLKEDPNKLYIITLGHLSKLLVYDLVKEGRRALDLGHLPKDYEYFRKRNEIKVIHVRYNNSNIMIGLPNVFDGFPKLEKGIIQFWTADYKGVEWLQKNINYSKQYYDTVISSLYISTYNTSCELVNIIYDNMKEIFKDIDLVILRGNNSEVYDYDVFEYAKTQKIFFAPPKNAWEKYDELREILLEEDENALYIICIGMSSEVLVMDLVKEGRRAMDMGHLAKDNDCYMKGEYDYRFFR